MKANHETALELSPVRVALALTYTLAIGVVTWLLWTGQ